MNIAYNNRRLPRHFFGAALSAGSSLFGGISKLIRAKKERRARKRKEFAADEALVSSHPTTGVGDVNYYAAMGGDVGTDIKGKNMPVKPLAGGNMQALASDAGKIMGDAHGQDTDMDGQEGVTIGNEAGAPIAEVEDKEVTIGTKVFSNRLPAGSGKTFANEAETLAQEKSIVEKQKKGMRDNIKLHTLNRELEAVNDKVEILFNEQEKVKAEAEAIMQAQAEKEQAMAVAQNGNIQSGVPMGGNAGAQINENGMPMASFGKDLKNLLSGNSIKDEEEVLENEPLSGDPKLASPNMKTSKNFLQDMEETTGDPAADAAALKRKETVEKASGFLDNAVNLGLTLASPTPPEPITTQAARLPKRVNMSGVKTGITEDGLAAMEAVENNSSSGATANANRLGIAANVIKNKRDVSVKEAMKNVELESRANLNAQGVAQRNADIGNKYLEDVNASKIGRLENMSEIFGDAEDEIAGFMAQDNLKDLDKSKMLLNAQKYSETGVIGNMIGMPFFDNWMLTDTDAAKTFGRQLKAAGKTDQLKAFKDAYGLTDEDLD